VFGIDSGEILIIAVVALVVIGPKDLPRAMRAIGNWVGRARGMAKHFRSGIDTMMREAELEDMEKAWKANNERIMREHPDGAAESDWGKPLPSSANPPPPFEPEPPEPPRPARARRPRKAGAAPPIPNTTPPPPGDGS
jgi:sec-independent protein translocase protein TatB